MAAENPGYAALLNKPCHNCRRRRLRCDRSRPGCHKCAVAGHDCLGYDKIFVWTQGVAVRGKMSGRTFGVLGVDHGAMSGSASGIQDGRPTQPRSCRNVDLCDLQALTDPILQRLDQRSRLYLAHFADRVCKDLVAHDGPRCNPFRELIPLAVEHPLLLHILIATSAIHLSNIAHGKASSLAAPGFDPGGRLRYLRANDDRSRRAFMDALVAKQEAIGQLRLVLDNVASADGEVLLAAVLFFVDFELIDLGKTWWKTHLLGASKLMSILIGATPVLSRPLRDCIMADFVIYHILGSTLTSAGLAVSISRHALDFLAVLERAEANSYLCCPPKLLEIILSASQLCGDPSPTLPTAHAALRLIDEALSFDIHGWAVGLQRLCTVTDLISREHVASAHRSAVCLYILQAVPSVRPLARISVQNLVSDVLRWLSVVDEADALFKATAWPTFIAGAEMYDPGQRAWTLDRLLKVWLCCPWGYIVTAIEMLRETWLLRDAAAEDDEGVSGLRKLWALNPDCLVV